MDVAGQDAELEVRELLESSIESARNAREPRTFVRGFFVGSQVGSGARARSFLLTRLLLIDNMDIRMSNDTRKSDNEEPRIYNRLAVLRAERGLTRQALAEAVGVNYQTIGFLERGDYNPSLTLAFALSRYFGVPVEAIFSSQPFQPLKSWPAAGPNP